MLPVGWASNAVLLRWKTGNARVQKCSPRGLHVTQNSLWHLHTMNITLSPHRRAFCLRKASAERKCYLPFPCITRGFPGGTSGKEPACQCRQTKNLSINAGRRKELKFNPWVRKIAWRRAWQPTPVFLSGKSHGQRTLEG